MGKFSDLKTRKIFEKPEEMIRQEINIWKNKRKLSRLKRRVKSRRKRKKVYQLQNRLF